LCDPRLFCAVLKYTPSDRLAEALSGRGRRPRGFRDVLERRHLSGQQPRHARALRPSSGTGAPAALVSFVSSRIGGPRQSAVAGNALGPAGVHPSAPGRVGPDTCHNCVPCPAPRAGQNPPVQSTIFRSPSARRPP
jgi:hypothetical protein